MNNSLVRLTEVLSTICPIDGVSGTVNTRIDYKAEATQEQKEAAQAALAAFDWSDEAHNLWEKNKRREAALALINSNEPAMVVVRALALVVKRRVSNLLVALNQQPLSTEQLTSMLVDVIVEGEVDNSMPSE